MSVSDESEASEDLDAARSRAEDGAPAASSAAAVPLPAWIEAGTDPRLDAFREISDRAWLDRRGLFVAEGRAILELVLRSERFEVASLLVSPSSLEWLRDRDLLTGQRLPAGASVFVCSRAAMRETSGFAFHQGAVGLVRRPAERSLVSCLHRSPAGSLRVLVADDVTDPDNIGGLFRNAFAFGCDAVVLSPRCASPYYRKAIRTSLGATLRVPFVHASDWEAMLDELERADVRLVAMSPALDAEPLTVLGRAQPLPLRLGVCVGNEGRGLGETLSKRSTLRLRIPMVPAADSVNVATAAAIVLARIHEIDTEAAPALSGS